MLGSVHLAEFSTNHLHKAGQARKIAEWKADNTSMWSLYLFPACQKIPPLSACASKRTSLLLHLHGAQEQSQKLSQGKAAQFP